MKLHWRAIAVMSEIEWTMKYKRALLEKNPALRMNRIEEARDAMTARRKEIARTSPEKDVLDRALDILATLHESYANENT
jgi:hypothetical protein